jgi:MraZ protein
MFFGEFEYKIDEKGRVPIPPKFRVALRGGVVLSPGVEGCITAYPMSEWDKLASAISEGVISPSKLRMLKRAVFATAFNLEIDNQGRIALPPPLRQHAEIISEVVIIGANNYFELWNKIRWGEEKAMFQEKAWELLEGLEEHR